MKALIIGIITWLNLTKMIGFVADKLRDEYKAQKNPHRG